MIHPGKPSQLYAAIIPGIKALGYHVDLKPGYSSNEYAFKLTVSRHETAYVDRHNTWWRDDGISGDSPMELLDRYRIERLTEARRHLDDDDMNAIAFDVLALDTQVDPAAVIDVRESGSSGVWTIEYRRKVGGVDTIPLADAKDRLAGTIGRLAREWDLDGMVEGA